MTTGLVKEQVKAFIRHSVDEMIEQGLVLNQSDDVVEKTIFDRVVALQQGSVEIDEQTASILLGLLVRFEYARRKNQQNCDGVMQ